MIISYHTDDIHLNILWGCGADILPNTQTDRKLTVCVGDNSVQPLYGPSRLTLISV